MVMALVDTSIIVDVLRGYPNASTWFPAQQQLGVSRYVWFETLQGTQNKASQQRAISLLKTIPDVIEVTPQDHQWALNALLQYRLSHNVDVLDCLIAAASQRLQVPLYTRNLKHFQPMLGTLAQQPYA